MTIKPRTFLILLAIFFIWLVEFAPVPHTSATYNVTKADGSNSPVTDEDLARIDAEAHNLTNPEGK